MKYWMTVINDQGDPCERNDRKQSSCRGPKRRVPDRAAWSETFDRMQVSLEFDVRRRSLYMNRQHNTDIVAWP